jgi:uncharacterized membrane protein YciS (DUF1049 family)
MRLIKRLIELAFVILVISLFMKNKDVVMSINYFGLKEPITVAFWELVTFCVSLGIIIAAVGDFVTQLKWLKERHRLVKTDKGHQAEVGKLNDRIEELESESQRLSRELEQKSGEIDRLKKESDKSATGLPDSPATEIDGKEESEEEKSGSTF